MTRIETQFHSRCRELSDELVQISNGYMNSHELVNQLNDDIFRWSLANSYNDDQMIGHLQRELSSLDQKIQGLLITQKKIFDALNTAATKGTTINE